MKITGRIVLHGLGIKEVLEEALECSRIEENGGLTNSGFRFFVMKNTVNKGHLSQKEGVQVPSPNYGLEIPAKSQRSIKELTLVLKAVED